MEQYILKAAARFIVPSLAAAILLRLFQILAWPWWLSLPVAGFVFWHYCSDGTEATKKFLDENAGKALRLDPCLQFLARSFLWSSLPVITAAVAYGVFPVLLPDRGASLGIVSGEGLHDGNTNLRELWYQFVRELPREGVLGIRCFVAFLFGLIVLGLQSQVEKVDEEAEDFHHRGRKEITLKEAARNAKKLRKANDPGIFFGGVQLPSAWSVLHFLFIGAPGSGKTLCMKLLAQCVLRYVGRGRGVRALWFDAKQDSLSELAGMGVPFKTLNMFDKRGVAWDMAKDITDETQAEAMAEILMPKNERASQPYFDDAARSLLKGVLCNFIERKPGRWTFRDVIFTLRSRSRLVQVLRQTPEGRELLELYFSKDTVLDVLSTVANKTDPYKAIAAAWARAEEKISLADWVEDEYVLVLGNSHVARPAMRAMNQVIFKRASQLLLEQPNNTHKRTWIFLDELRQAGKLDGLESFAVEGRSKGCCLVLGCQDKEGLEAVYGEKEAGEILGVCAIKAFLRIESAKTARWASDTVGEEEKFEYTDSVTTPHDPAADVSETKNEQLVKRDVILPSEFMQLPPTDKRHGLTAFYLAPGVGVWKATLSPKFLAENLAPPDRSVPDTVRRPRDELRLEPWSEEEMKELGLSPAQEPKQEKDQEQELDEPKQENKGPKPAPLKTLRPKPNREPELPVQ
jgi:hypothetical protein